MTLPGPSLAERLARAERTPWWDVDGPSPEVASLERLAALWDHLGTAGLPNGLVVDLSDVPGLAYVVSTQLASALPDSLVLTSQEETYPYRSPHWRLGEQDPPSHHVGSPFGPSRTMPGLSVEQSRRGTDLLVWANDELDESARWALRLEGTDLVLVEYGDPRERVALGSHGLEHLSALVGRFQSDAPLAPVPGEERAFDALRTLLEPVVHGGVPSECAYPRRRAVEPLGRPVEPHERANLRSMLNALSNPLGAYLGEWFSPTSPVASRGRDSWDLFAGLVHEKLTPEQVELVVTLSAESADNADPFDGMGLVRLAAAFD